MLFSITNGDVASFLLIQIAHFLMPPKSEKGM